MKKRTISFALILCMILSVFGMTGCDVLEAFSESDYIYDAEKVQAAIDSLTESGYKITIRYLIVDNGANSQPEMESSGFSIAADGDLWYCEQVEDEETTTTIMDFSDDAQFITYTKTADAEKWEKAATSYDSFGGKDAVKTLYMDTYLAILTSYGVLGFGLKDQGAVTIAGRACTKYAVSVSVLGASYSNEYCIDNETGLCLKNVIAVGSTTEGSASTSYECTAFEVGYRITLPADSDCTEVNGDNSGNTGNTGSVSDLDFGSILAGNGATDTVWGKQDEATKQQIIDEGKKDGVDISFGADGSMTVVDPENGTTVTQNPDGTWTVKGDDGTTGQYGGNWPENEFTRLLPKPEMELLVAATNEQEFTVGFNNATIDQVKAYAEAVKAKGFTVDAQTSDQTVGNLIIYSYTAKNTDGYIVTVSYAMGTSAVLLEKP